MKKVIALSVSAVLLYSCATVDNNNISHSRNSDSLAARLKKIEQRIEENSINIGNNSKRLDRVYAQLLAIQKRIAKEAKKNPLSSYIPPASAISNSAQTNQAKMQPKIEKKSVLVNIFAPENTSKKKIQKPKKKKKSVDEIDKALYESALKLYNNGDFKGAKHLFEDFINNHPHSRYVDNAMFWLAYTYLHLNELEKGASMLKRIVKEYPDDSIQNGGKTDVALYTLYKMYKNMPDERAKFRKILLDRFPKSKYAKLVK